MPGRLRGKGIEFMEFMFDMSWPGLALIIGIFIAGLILGIGYLIGKYYKRKKPEEEENIVTDAKGDRWRLHDEGPEYLGKKKE